MVQGEVRQIIWVEQRDTPFTGNAGSSSIAIRKPDGTMEGSPPTISVNPGSAGLVQTFTTAAYTFADAGEYQIYWRISTTSTAPGSAAELIGRNLRYFASWIGINHYVRDKLQVTPDLLVEGSIDPMVGSIVRWLMNTYPQIGPYENLQIWDQFPFDECVALMTAAHLREYLPKRVAVGEIVRIRSGPSDYFFQKPPVPPGSGGSPKSGSPDPGFKSVEQGWLDLAWDCLKQVSGVQTELTTLQDTAQMFAVAGRTRQMQSLGYFSWKYSPFYKLVLDQAFDFRLGWPGLVPGTLLGFVGPGLEGL